MLRLLPKRLYAGLFGQHAWLAHGAGGQPVPAVPMQSSASLPESLDALLRTSPPGLRASELSVMLPSHAAHSVSLPWTPNLRGDDEMRVYAQAHMEQAGLSTGEAHVVHAEFRHYGACGLAYAVPQQLLEELHAVAARHRLDLTTVLPICGVAHLSSRRVRGVGAEISLVVEDVMVSALVLNRMGLQRYDAEPTVGGQRAALRRLLTRLAADDIEFRGGTLCADHDEDELAGIARALSSQAVVNQVKSSQWRRFL